MHVVGCPTVMAGVVISLLDSTGPGGSGSFTDRTDRGEAVDYATSFERVGLGEGDTSGLNVEDGVRNIGWDKASEIFLSEM